MDIKGEEKAEDTDTDPISSTVVGEEYLPTTYQCVKKKKGAHGPVVDGSRRPLSANPGHLGGATNPF